MVYFVTMDREGRYIRVRIYELEILIQCNWDWN